MLEKMKKKGEKTRLKTLDTHFCSSLIIWGLYVRFQIHSLLINNFYSREAKISEFIKLIQADPQVAKWKGPEEKSR